MSRFLMLVSARADGPLREAVRDLRRPCPEYLRLEARHGVAVLDWSRLGPGATARSARLSLAHARAALRELEGIDAVLSDGEHVGVPLAIGMRARRLRTPHLMLGHHLTTRAKRPVFRLLRPQHSISRVLVHSSRQLELAAEELAIPRSRLDLLPYHADTDFWAPRPAVSEALVLSVGREHRDFATLARACADVPARVLVAAGSLFSPAARRHDPQAWPANFEVGFADHLALRDAYARAAVVVVPLVPTDFQAGVTSILEAMAMARPVVVTATEGQRDIVEDGVTGAMVPPGDPAALREAVARLLASPGERRRLGANAREAVVSRFGLDAYVDRVSEHLCDIASAGAPHWPSSGVVRPPPQPSPSRGEGAGGSCGGGTCGSSSLFVPARPGRTPHAHRGVGTSSMSLALTSVTRSP
jgi:glycosyltransferase involved in cell wall biosynthesis